jgi:hypothetical protein
MNARTLAFVGLGLLTLVGCPRAPQRQDNRQDRQEDRQDNRQERQDDRQDNRQERQDDRQN